MLFEYGSMIAAVSVFFFKQKTAYEIKECDWSSDVCSSDLYEYAYADDESNGYDYDGQNRSAYCA